MKKKNGGCLLISVVIHSEFHGDCKLSVTNVWMSGTSTLISTYELAERLYAQ